ncbi:minor tail protein [Mycobacterium phage Edugator]|uniref:Minor tail protein n=4 Tax=Kratiovirus larva TaxID=1056831 RepID=A0A221J737_9CAUD|nr:minor tail protein [Mycobacterium phage Larva]ASM62529.1 minor tail protein [Mycobacterium phage AlleyCat]ASR85719.1 minor tail protein [Mycobacterium phage Edugator]QQV92628.1 hypothetical protein SEA_PSYCHO_23 [Mycobacterium phage Psycho]WAB09704.1 minor tail protein [Mycobacterium phage Dadosky]AEL19678.1 hypothetical protein LARVA_23 [Mycobacterium phage Larva]
MELQHMPAPPKIPERQHDPLSDAMYDIAEALQYPQDSRGRTYDVRYLIPILSFHLARAGAVIDPDRAIIRKQAVPPPAEIAGTGLAEGWDAIRWVHPDEPQSVEDELRGATLDDLPRLSPEARAEFLRRAGGDPKPPAPQLNNDVDLDARTPWHVETSIHFDEDEESTE